MAEGHGGYRRPNNPAPVSGPGALSARTDGGPTQPIREVPGGSYGDRQELTALQGQAPMGAGPDLSGVVPFGAPSQRPTEPVTAGMPGGPGAGPSYGAPGGMTPDQMDRLRSYLPVLLVLASREDASPDVKQYVRQLRGELG